MYYNRKRAPLEFKVGDKILLSTKHLQLDSSHKLQPRFVEPFVIQAKVGRLAFQLNLGTRYIETYPVFHVSLLHRYHTSRDGCAISKAIMIQDEQE